MAEMTQPEAITPVLHAITSTSEPAAYDVWLVGSISDRAFKGCSTRTNSAAAAAVEMLTRWWGGSYMYWWNQQVATLLLDHARARKD